MCAMVMVDGRCGSEECDDGEEEEGTHGYSIIQTHMHTKRPMEMFISGVDSCIMAVSTRIYQTVR